MYTGYDGITLAALSNDHHSLMLYIAFTDIRATNENMTFDIKIDGLPWRQSRSCKHVIEDLESDTEYELTVEVYLDKTLYYNSSIMTRTKPFSKSIIIVCM